MTKLVTFTIPVVLDRFVEIYCAALRKRKGAVVTVSLKYHFRCFRDEVALMESVRPTYCALALKPVPCRRVTIKLPADLADRLTSGALNRVKDGLLVVALREYLVRRNERAHEQILEAELWLYRFASEVLGEPTPRDP